MSTSRSTTARTSLPSESPSDSAPLETVGSVCAEFSSSDVLCGRCEDWWQASIERLATELGQSGQWSPWSTPFTANGVRFERGNPIASGRSRTLDRAFKVILLDPPVTDGIYGWVAEHDTLNGEIDFPSHELVVVMEWSDEAAAFAMGVLRQWMLPDTTPEVVEELFAQRERRNTQNT
jgi:hypothetical protein